jgi:rSAM/selenodomain-associated transferase 2
MRCCTQQAQKAPMISVVIPTLNSEAGLPATLARLVPAAVDGLVREVIIVDGGSSDGTRAIAELTGARLIAAARGRGTQLAAGAAKARFPWLLFLHADTVLEEGWQREASEFMYRVDTGECAPTAAAFRFALDDQGLRPRLLERLVALRCTILALPYGDQGLLIPKRLYEALGGYRPLALMEDVDLVRRLGSRRLSLLRSRAITSAERFKRDGYGQRSTRNLLCLALYLLRVPVSTIHRLYG